MKFTAPRIELAPAKCSEKIAKSTEAPAWAILLERGGYTVQPVPGPLSTKDLDRSITNAGNKSQKLILFIRGNAISAAPSIKGMSQLPKPPIKIGITIKKIMINACAVTTTLYTWSSPIKLPACPNSIRIIILRPVPTIPDHMPANKYKVPISLWLQDHSHLMWFISTKIY